MKSVFTLKFGVCLQKRFKIDWSSNQIDGFSPKYLWTAHMVSCSHDSGYYLINIWWKIPTLPRVSFLYYTFSLVVNKLINSMYPYCHGMLILLAVSCQQENWGAYNVHCVTCLLYYNKYFPRFLDRYWNDFFTKLADRRINGLSYLSHPSSAKKLN